MRLCLLYFPENPVYENPVYEVEWRASNNFCSGPGAYWKYQECETLKNVLNVALLEHYKWSGFITTENSSVPVTGDKTKHSLFLVCCGAGTGKSRLLDEFHKSCCDVTTSEPGLHKKLKDAFVFKVDMENGTSSSDSFKRSLHYITSRMYWQIIVPKKSWEEMSSADFPHLTFSEIFEKLAICKAMNKRDLTIIIEIDGLHKLEHTKGSKSSTYYSTLSLLPPILSAYLALTCSHRLLLSFFSIEKRKCF